MHKKTFIAAILAGAITITGCTSTQTAEKDPTSTTTKPAETTLEDYELASYSSCDEVTSRIKTLLEPHITENGLSNPYYYGPFGPVTDAEADESFDGGVRQPAITVKQENTQEQNVTEGSSYAIGDGWFATLNYPNNIVVWSATQTPEIIGFYTSENENLHQIMELNNKLVTYGTSYDTQSTLIEIYDTSNLGPLSDPVVDKTAVSETILEQVLKNPPEIDINQVDLFDIEPQKAAQSIQFDGSITNLRGYDKKIQVASVYPVLNAEWDTNNNQNAGLRERNAAIERNKEILANLTIENFLPYMINENGEGADLLDCDRIHLPETAEEAPQFTAMVTIDIDNTDDVEGSIILDRYDVFYSAGDKTALVKNSYTGRPNTVVHLFETDDPQYNGSAKLSGTVQTSWPLDIVNDTLRVATNNTEGTNITVLDTNNMETLGETGRVAPGEDIKAVRYENSYAHLVTFRQIDPLFLISLEDPTNPEVVDELKIEGFSGYLHNVGNGLLVGIGVPGTQTGTTQGVQITLFSSGVYGTNLQIEDQITLTGEDYENGVIYGSSAVWDHQAISYDPQTNTFVIGIDYGPDWRKIEQQIEENPESGYDEYQLYTNLAGPTAMQFTVNTETKTLDYTLLESPSLGLTDYIDKTVMTDTHIYGLNWAGVAVWDRETSQLQEIIGTVNSPEFEVAFDEGFAAEEPAFAEPIEETPATEQTENGTEEN